MKAWLMGAALAAMAGAAIAAPPGWVTYTNAAYGYVLEVPPGFVSRPQTDSPQGQTFAGDRAEIMVWGERLAGRDFEAEVQALLKRLTEDGWAMSFQMTTPRHASFELRKGAVVMRARLIAVCAGQGVAQYRVGYGRADGPALQSVLDTMETGFRASGDCGAI